MRIAQVITATTGGVGRHVASVVARLIERGHAVRLYAPAQSVQLHHLDELGADLLPLARLGRLAGADVVHAHGYKAGAVAVPVCRLRRFPLVTTWHNAVPGSGWQRGAGRLLQALVARGSHLTLCASSDLVAEARRLGAHDVRFAPVAAPVLGPPVVPRDVQRRELGLSDDDMMILTVGRLAPQKNLSVVLDIARAVKDHPELIFIIAGEGPQRDELTERARADGSKVRLIGQWNDIASMFAAADIALLTSTWEARALVAQEALLAGVPLISTQVGGITELVGDAAVLFDPRDVTHAVTELLDLANKPERRAALRAAGLTRASSWPGEDQVVDNLVAIYQHLAA
jgi:glycosyltransferase involved in cell wall biosynthesis